MVETVVKVMLPSGLHARPASNFVKLAGKFGSQVFIEKQGNVTNAKSIIGIMSMAVTSGTEVIVRAEGDDAQQAVQELVEFLSRDEE